MTSGQVTTAHLSLREASVFFSLGEQTICALDSVSLDVAEGATICLVGPSGCGKSTILNLIAGFLSPSEGEVAVQGRPVNGPGADRAVVFQADAVFPWLTVRENLEFGPKSRDELDAAAKERIDHYLELMHLDGFADAYPKSLSGGMKKRVDVARAYVNQPEVILLDEPFGAIDDMTKSHLQRELMRLSVEDPTTSLFITHDIEEAIYLGDIVVVMTPRPGRVREIIEIPYERPRDLSIKTTESFQSIRRHIQGLLGEVE